MFSSIKCINYDFNHLNVSGSLNKCVKYMMPGDVKNISDVCVL